MTTAHSRHPDDVVLWPDGTTATLADVRNGDFDHMSDDYEIISIDDVARLEALDALPEPMPERRNKEQDALRKALEFVILFLAFDGRDRGTDRMDRSLASLSAMACEMDILIRAALSGNSGAPHGPPLPEPAACRRPAPGDRSGQIDTGPSGSNEDHDIHRRPATTREPRTVHVAAIQHDLGYEVFAAFGRERLDHMVGGFCRARWAETGDDRDPELLDDATVIRLWFDSDQHELKTMEIVDDGCESVGGARKEAY